MWEWGEELCNGYVSVVRMIEAIKEMCKCAMNSEGMNRRTHA